MYVGFLFDPLHPSYLGEDSLQSLQKISELSPDFLHLTELLLESGVSRPQLLHYTCYQ